MLYEIAYNWITQGGALVILNMYQAKKQPAATEMPAKALGKKAISAMDFYQADARGIMYNVE